MGAVDAANIPAVPVQARMGNFFDSCDQLHRIFCVFLCDQNRRRGVCQPDWVYDDGMGGIWGNCNPQRATFNAGLVCIRLVVCRRCAGQSAENKTGAIWMRAFRLLPPLLMINRCAVN